MENQQPKRRSKLKIFGCVLLVLVAIAAAAAGGAYLWYKDAIYTAPQVAAEPRFTLTVNEGQSLLDIAPQLEKEKVIKSTLALRAYLFLEKPSVNLLKGKYLFERNLNVPEVLQVIAKGPVKQTVTARLQEGTRFDEYAPRLTTAFAEIPDRKFDTAEFNNIAANPDSIKFSAKVDAYLKAVKPAGKSLEGFLHPDTYVIGSDATAKDVIDLMISTQLRRLEENNIDYKTAKGRLGNFYQVLTMASIVERESKAGEERRIISDLFMRRLANGEILGADATTLYPFKDWKHALTIAELRDTSNLYNTRARRGLVPTPICNPSLDAIKAVLNPTANQYVYFLHGKDGKTYFARTYAEHQRNISRYL
jgi:UPF0755 protein